MQSFLLSRETPIVIDAFYKTEQRKMHDVVIFDISFFSSSIFIIRHTRNSERCNEINITS